ncbi:hypothetical protein LINPERHAP1_LOCUS43440, partial [Linum perenne]
MLMEQFHAGVGCFGIPIGISIFGQIRLTHVDVEGDVKFVLAWQDNRGVSLE